MSSIVPYQSLAEALRERMAVISDRELYQRDPAAHLEKLKVVSHRIDECAAALPPPVSGELAHYIHRASFAKALAWIEEHVAKAGAAENVS